MSCKDGDGSDVLHGTPVHLGDSEARAEDRSLHVTLIGSSVLVLVAAGEQQHLQILRKKRLQLI
ncbi:hypothetical protein E2C01_089930 [Portunus trituberculatus]|uniref:Uncharacterized protein n=1 Tax=Portunus trituberculatus TaxID=210409 RepID=A0A5B7JKK6_PORTR|nr:hypothetical protein [Portunus trituberculatus]